MGLITFLGKLLIIASLGFQAFLLYQDKSSINSFDSQLNKALSSCKCEMLTPEIIAHIKEHLRLVLTGLLASSALFLFFKCWCFKIPTFLGLSILLWIQHHETFRVVPTIDILNNTSLWHSLGVIGAIIYLMGAECSSVKGGCEAKK